MPNEKDNQNFIDRAAEFFFNVGHSVAGAFEGIGKLTVLMGQTFRQIFGRRFEWRETLKQIETEQKTLRDQLSQTGGQIVQVAQQVFDALQQRLQALASVRLPPALAGAAAAAGPIPAAAHTYNFYIGGRQVTAGTDISRIADQLAEMLEREHTYARD